jgi:hypothetical protein
MRLGRPMCGADRRRRPARGDRSAPVQGADQYVLIRPTDRDDWHLWRPPSGQVVAAVSPRAGLALTSQRTSDDLKTTFSCYRLERA